MTDRDSERSGVQVAAVVVAHDRRKLLAEALTALGAQSRPPDVLIVVDNASSDGTPDMVRDRFPYVDLVALPYNTGGAGGFAAGIAEAMRRDVGAVWLLDDDAVPEPQALEALLAARAGYPAPHRPTLVASRVLWTDGRPHPMNTPRRKPAASAAELAAAEAVGCVPVRSASFVSVLLDAAVIRERGLPVADYFLWNDDFEYTTRLLRGRRGLLCPASVVVHKTRAFGAIDADPGERFYFEVRNKLWLFTRSSALTPAEKALYAGSTARRWARTALRSRERATLARGLLRGTVDGLWQGPRSTQRLLADAGLEIPVGLPGAVAVPAPEDIGPATEDPSGVTQPQPFSLLMPVWAGDRPDFVRRAFNSAVHEQTRRPDEVVLVQDGPVPGELESCLTELVAAAPMPVTRVRLDENAGLGPALEAGLAACRHDIVARMDADDISLPHRFAVQLPLIEAGVDLIGSALLEFGLDERAIVGRRTPPTDPAEIVRYSRFADPFNHPTVVYRRSAVRAAGGYEHVPLMEDYLLFARMIAQGARVANVGEPLVLYRVGAGAYDRRGGRDLLRSEVELQRRLLREGFISRGQFLRNVAVRGGYRFVPVALRRRAYRRFIATRGERGPRPLRASTLNRPPNPRLER